VLYMANGFTVSVLPSPNTAFFHQVESLNFTVTYRHYCFDNFLSWYISDSKTSILSTILSVISSGICINHINNPLRHLLWHMYQYINNPLRHLVWHMYQSYQQSSPSSPLAYVSIISTIPSVISSGICINHIHHRQPTHPPPFLDHV
jgi:hypothetical protein